MFSSVFPLLPLFPSLTSLSANTVTRWMGPCVMTRGRPGSVIDGREAKGRSRVSLNLRRLLCRTPLLPPAPGPSVHSRGAVGLAEGGSLGSSLGFGGHLRYRPRAMGGGGGGQGGLRWERSSRPTAQSRPARKPGSDSSWVILWRSKP